MAGTSTAGVPKTGAYLSRRFRHYENKKARGGSTASDFSILEL